MRFLLFVCFALSLLVINGCIPYHKLVNYQGLPEVKDTVLIQNATKIRLQSDDVLRIKVYSSDMETAAPFNLVPNSTNEFYSLESIQLSGYLIDKEGAVELPVLGKVFLKGLTISEAMEKVKEKLMEYVKDPVVNIRLLNFKITVSGEVLNPGSFNIINERISIPEALALAGDLTSYADRSNLLIVREEDGVRSFATVDLLSSNVFQSEFFYLKQNDLIYVKPISAKTGSVEDQTTKTIPIITAAATVIAVIISIAYVNR